MPYTPENNPYIPGDPYSYDLKWIVRQLKRINVQLAKAVESYGSPLVVHHAAEMRDRNRIYIYLGSEPGYNSGDWYYYDPDTHLWTSGGQYGGYPIDDALDADSVNAVENQAVTAAIKGARSIIPIYKGDIYDEGFGTICKHGNHIYLLASYNNSGNLGKLYIVNTSTNAVESVLTTVYCGHGNSMTYNAAEDAYYIAPVYYYDNNNDPIATQQIIKYNNDFSSFETINAPATIQGVGYNYVDGQLYAYDYFGTLYRYSNGIFNTLANIGVQAGYIQDFAIYGDFFYVNAPTGLMFKAAYTEDSAEILEYYNAACFDVSGKWQLGEYEGIDFDEDGRMYCTNYINNPMSAHQAYVLEIPVTPVPNVINYASYPFNLYSDTMALSDATIDKFELGYNEIRHINQLMNMITQPNTIAYQATSNKYAAIRTIIKKPVTITFWNGAAYYTTKILLQALVNMYSLAAGMVIYASDDPAITFDRQGGLVLSGYAIEINSTDELALAMTANYMPVLNVSTLPTHSSGNAVEWQYSGNDLARGLYSGLEVIKAY